MCNNMSTVTALVVYMTSNLRVLKKSLSLTSEVGMGRNWLK